MAMKASKRDPDNPPWTAEERTNARRGADHLPRPVRKALVDTPRRAEAETTSTKRRRARKERVTR